MGNLQYRLVFSNSTFFPREAHEVIFQSHITPVYENLANQKTFYRQVQFDICKITVTKYRMFNLKVDR